MIEMQRMELRAYVNLQARSSPGSGPCGQFLLEPFAGVGSPELRGGCQVRVRLDREEGLRTLRATGTTSRRDLEDWLAAEELVRKEMDEARK